MAISRPRLTALACLPFFFLASHPAAASPQPYPSPQGAAAASQLHAFEVLVNGSTSLTRDQRTALGRLGAAIDGQRDGVVRVTANAATARDVEAHGYTLRRVVSDADRANAFAAKHAAENPTVKGWLDDEFPSGYEDYHTFAEVLNVLNDTVIGHWDIADTFTMGVSTEGRPLRAIKISDNVLEDEDEPEIVITCNVHAREHLTTEQCLYLIKELTDNYGKDERITKLVNGREIVILPMQNPDGAMYDISGRRFHMWRKTRFRNSDGSYGIDPNRNYGYKWGASGGSSSNPRSETYRGRRAFEAPETAALRDYFASRVVNGKQQIQGHLDIHTYSELIMWPYSYTYSSIVPGMTRDQYSVFSTLGKAMARTNNYTPQQSSDLYVADGVSSDWAWGSEKVWSYIFELYPRSGGFYPSDSVIPRETRRNRESLLMFMEHADCFYKATGKQSTYCSESDWKDAR